jgi:hypothetical protein
MTDQQLAVLTLRKATGIIADYLRCSTRRIWRLPSNDLEKGHGLRVVK